ncbi:MAG: rhodanese-like domain-containing protein [Clostridia bacterium]|nr:rhodanese-like domain-containing protein [Clostridia bacterium]
MNFMDLFKQVDINKEIKEYKGLSGAVLLDVRTPSEYSEGHIEGSVNIPVQTIRNAENVIENKETPIYVYCYSGSRSSQAKAALSRMGYKNVKNIGGISAYSGKVVK